MSTWVEIADGVRMMSYSFGPGRANTLAVRLEPRSWLIISPSAGAPEAALDEIDREGAATALIAPNAYHHLGQTTWRARFPSAVSYAPEGALPRLAKVCPNVPFRSIRELTLPSHVGFFEPKGMRNPDLMLRVDTPKGIVWFSGDVISNTTPADLVAPLRWLFTLVGGGPGFRLNNMPAMAYLKDRPTWKASVREAMAAHPPSIVVPAHGDPVTEDAERRTNALLV